MIASNHAASEMIASMPDESRQPPPTIPVEIATPAAVALVVSSGRPSFSSTCDSVLSSARVETSLVFVAPVSEFLDEDTDSNVGSDRDAQGVFDR